MTFFTQEGSCGGKRVFQSITRFPAVLHSPSVPPRSAREPHAALGSRTQSSLPPRWWPAFHPRGTSGTVLTPLAAAHTGTCGWGLRGQRCVSTCNHLLSHGTPQHPWATIHVFQRITETSSIRKMLQFFSKHWDKWDDNVREEYRAFYNNIYKVILYIPTYKMLQNSV